MRYLLQDPNRPDFWVGWDSIAQTSLPVCLNLNAFCLASQVWEEELGPLLVNSISLVLEEQRETILPLLLILKFLMPEILGIRFITWRNKPIWISNLLFLFSLCICSGQGSYYPLIFQVMEHSNPALEADYQDILSSMQNGSRTTCLVMTMGNLQHW